VAAGVGVEGALADQAVDAGLGAQEAVGVFAAHLDGSALDAGHFAFGFFEQLDVETLALAVAQVHALKHAGPVLGLGAAAPDWISMKQALPSIGLLNMRRNSSSPTRASRLATSASTACMVSSSSSMEASSKRSLPSARPCSISCRVMTTPSRVFFSLPSSWAWAASFQMFGSSSCLLTSISFSALVS
jgi:hypothetical protein